MKILKNIAGSMLSIFIWAFIAIVGYIGALLLFQAILGPDSGGRGEVLRSLYAIGIAGVLTLCEIIILFKWKHRFQAISVLIVSILFGGYFLLIVIAFGQEYLFPEHHKRIANQRVEPIVKTPVDKAEAQGTQAHP